jgi:hypothetical protein
MTCQNIGCKRDRTVALKMCDAHKKDQSVSARQRRRAMTKGEQTRREIVEKAAPLFNQKGYRRGSGRNLPPFFGRGGACHGGARLCVGESRLGQARGSRCGRKPCRPLEKDNRELCGMRAGLVAGGCLVRNTDVESDHGNDARTGRLCEAGRNSWRKSLRKGSRKMTSTSAWIRRISRAGLSAYGKARCSSAGWRTTKSPCATSRSIWTSAMSARGTRSTSRTQTGQERKGEVR